MLLDQIGSVFVYFSLKTGKSEILIKKTQPHALELHTSKHEDFAWFSGFCFQSYAQKWELRNNGNSTKMT